MGLVVHREEEVAPRSQAGGRTRGVELGTECPELRTEREVFSEKSVCRLQAQGADRVKET